MDATNAIGFLAIWAFVWIAWFLYTKKVWPILLAELAALLFYLMVSYVVPFYVDHDGLIESISFWSAWGVMIPVSLAMIVFLPAKLESDYKSPLPVLLKTLLIFMMVLFVVLAKSHMRGFITSFPYVTIFAVYESRHSLYTVARRMPSFIIPFLPVLLFCRYLPEHVGFAGALVASWVCFIPMFILMDRFYTRRDNAILQSLTEGKYKSKTAAGDGKAGK